MVNVEDYIKKTFGVNVDVFVDVMKMSPSAEWYIHGSLSEYLFRQYAEWLWYEVHRIKEKPEWWYNAKIDEARWDFYIRKKWSQKDEWYVIESKWIKTNTEKHLFSLDSKEKLFKHLKSLAFPKETYLEDSYNKWYKAYLQAKEKREEKNKWEDFPAFKWDKNMPWARSFNLVWLRDTEEDLKHRCYSIDESKLTTESYLSWNWPVKMLTTHAPSNRVAHYTWIKQAAPLVTEFNIMCVDLFQRIWEHKFVFMNPEHIAHSPTSPEHLYQNYHIDYIIPGIKDQLNINPPRYDDLDECIRATKPVPRKIDESQLDLR